MYVQYIYSIFYCHCTEFTTKREDKFKPSRLTYIVIMSHPGIKEKGKTFAKANEKWIWIEIQKNFIERVCHKVSCGVWNTFNSQHMIYGCLTDLKNLMRALTFKANAAKLLSLHFSFKTYILLKHNLIYQEAHESFPECSS